MKKLKEILLFIMSVVIGVFAVLLFGRSAYEEKEKRKVIKKDLDKIVDSEKDVGDKKKELLNKYAKRVSVILIIMFASALFGSYKKTIDNEVWDFGSVTNYVFYLEDLTEYQSSVIKSNSKIARNVITNISVVGNTMNCTVDILKWSSLSACVFGFVGFVVGFITAK